METPHTQTVLEKPVLSEQPAPPARHDYTIAQRVLLLAALAMGVLISCLWDDVIAWETYWLVYIGLFYLLAWKRIGKNIEGYALLAPALFLCIWNLIGGGELYLLSAIAIPLLLMLHMVVCTAGIPAGREGAVLLELVRGFFVRPFAAVPCFFGALSSLLREGTKKGRAVGIGLLIGVPLAAGVLLLLASADDAMRALFAGFQTADAGHAIFLVLLALLFTVLFYSFFFSSLHGEPRALPAYREGNWNRTTLMIVIGLLLACYLVFIGTQFTYLFGNTLPREMTYSEYARSGFGELVCVALINLSLFGLTVRYGEKNGVLRVFCWALLVANALIIGSALMRLLMYINTYGLTMNRILPLWFIIYLIALTALCVARLVRERFLLMRVAAGVFIYWYVALTIPDWPRIIAAFNAVWCVGIR